MTSVPVSQSLFKYLILLGFSVISGFLIASESTYYTETQIELASPDYLLRGLSHKYKNEGMDEGSLVVFNERALVGNKLVLKEEAFRIAHTDVKTHDLTTDVMLGGYVTGVKKIGEKKVFTYSLQSLKNPDQMIQSQCVRKSYKSSEKVGTTYDCDHDFSYYPHSNKAGSQELELIGS